MEGAGFSPGIGGFAANLILPALNIFFPVVEQLEEPYGILKPLACIPEDLILIESESFLGINWFLRTTFPVAVDFIEPSIKAYALI